MKNMVIIYHTIFQSTTLLISDTT